MNTIINRLDKNANSDKDEAKQLQTNFKLLSKDSKILAIKIERTEKDFKQLDKNLEIKVHNLKMSTPKLSSISSFGAANFSSTKIPSMDTLFEPVKVYAGTVTGGSDKAIER